MRPSRRKPVNKHKSAKKFRRQTKRVATANMWAVSRGGIRF